MLMEELEAQCMAISHVVDTEIVEGDPKEIPTFDESTLYVWVVPGSPDVRAANDDGLHPHGTNIFMLRGRLGDKNETATSVEDLARKLGVSA